MVRKGLVQIIFIRCTHIMKNLAANDSDYEDCKRDSIISTVDESFRGSNVGKWHYIHIK